MRSVVVDTGPLVALLNSKDAHHAWAHELFAGLEPPLFTSEAVMAEACHLLRRVPGGPTAALSLVTAGVLAIRFALGDEAASVKSLMERYRSVPMSLADASLVHMTEMDAGASIATLDKDFFVYRRNGRRALRLLHPA